MTKQTTLLLASNSPRRRELIALGNWTVSLAVSNVDEGRRPDEPAREYVLRVAGAKARAAAEGRAEQIVVGADTAVVDGGSILGKPRDALDAVAMLKRLRGHAHQVYTGLAILRTHDRRLVTDLCITDIPMRDYSDAEIEAYVRTGDPLDKAGAYAIQHPHFQPVKSMQGCYASVMGLPLCHLMRTLHHLDIPAAADVPANCQKHLHYQCPVSSAILRGGQVG